MSNLVCQNVNHDCYKGICVLIIILFYTVINFISKEIKFRKCKPFATWQVTIKTAFFYYIKERKCGCAAYEKGNFHELKPSFSLLRSHFTLINRKMQRIKIVVQQGTILSCHQMSLGIHVIYVNCNANGQVVE